VRIRGTTKTLLVTSTPPNESIAAPSTLSTGPPPFSLSVFVSEIGLSLVDRAPQELLMVTLSEVRVECARTLALPSVDEDEIESAGLDSLDISVHMVQVDNQLPNTQFQVLLGPAKSWVAIPANDRPHTLQISIVRRYGHAGEFDFFEYASLSTFETDLKIDDTILLLIGRMLWECVMSLRSEEELVVGEVLSKEGPASRLRRWLLASPQEPAPNVSSVSLSKPDSNLSVWMSDLKYRIPNAQERDVARAYFKVLHLQSIKLNFTFRFTATDPRAVLSLSKFRTSGSLRGDDFNVGVLGRPALFVRFIFILLSFSVKNTKLISNTWL